MSAPEAAVQDPALLALRERHQALKKAQPRLRIREAARQLGVSEALLLSLDLGQGVRRLKRDGPGLLGRLEAVGPCMVLVRNELVVLEVTGPWVLAEASSGMIQMVSPSLGELRVWMDDLVDGYEVDLDGRQSLQWFDAEGQAVVKVFFDSGEGAHLMQTLTEGFVAADQYPGSPAGDAQSGQGRCLQGRFPSERAGYVGGEPPCLPSMEWWLRAAAEAARPLRMRCQNRSARLEVEDTVTRIVRMGEWLNVLDPLINLHARDGACERRQIRPAALKPEDAPRLESMVFDDESAMEVLRLTVATGLPVIQPSGSQSNNPEAS